MDTEQRARRVRALTEYVRQAFTRAGDRYQPVGQIETDYNPLPGTTSYDGRVLAFTFDSSGRQYRVTVEEITLDNPDE